MCVDGWGRDIFTTLIVQWKWTNESHIDNIMAVGLFLFYEIFTVQLEYNPHASFSFMVVAGRKWSGLHCNKNQHNVHSNSSALSMGNIKYTPPPFLKLPATPRNPLSFRSGPWSVINIVQIYFGSFLYVLFVQVFSPYSNFHCPFVVVCNLVETTSVFLQYTGTHTWKKIKGKSSVHL